MNQHNWHNNGTMKQWNNGFSILEIIVSIFIITMGLIGLLSLITQNIQAQYINKNVLIASQLAQEGLELTRNVRDGNWLDTNNPWAFDEIAVSDNTKTFIIEFDGTTTDVDDIDDDNAKLNISGDLYIHSAGTDSGFSRIIETINSYAASSTAVSAIVQWSGRGQTRQYVADTVLYDWR